uniref:Uncharacterized protein n=1 Tax=Oryza sativa subsp. japonica TaxID=39947 RepID=Q6Z627_ORYSJ|nr:hypothetical protein [Oryza sativa Japonica Group]
MASKASAGGIDEVTQALACRVPKKKGGKMRRNRRQAKKISGRGSWNRSHKSSPNSSPAALCPTVLQPHKWRT